MNRIKMLLAVGGVLSVAGCATTETTKAPTLTPEARAYNAQLDKLMGVKSCDNYECDYSQSMVKNSEYWQRLNEQQEMRQKNKQEHNNQSSFLNKK